MSATIISFSLYQFLLGYISNPFPYMLGKCSDNRINSFQDIFQIKILSPFFFLFTGYQFLLGYISNSALIQCTKNSNMYQFLLGYISNFVFLLIKSPLKFVSIPFRIYFKYLCCHCIWALQGSINSFQDIFQLCYIKIILNIICVFSYLKYILKGIDTELHGHKTA